MFVDVCIPKGNEEEFISIAEKLGTKGILFLYDKDDKKAKLQELSKKTKLRLYSGLLVTKNVSVPGITFAKAEQQNIENRNLKFMYDFEEQEEKDSFHYRRSGANQVICEMMKEKEKVLVFDMEKILAASKEREKLLGRMQQNLMLAQKYKLNCIICSFATSPANMRAEAEYASLIRSFGYEELAKKSIGSLHTILEQKD